jgi:uncharacterized protein
MSQIEIKINDIPIVVELAIDPSSRNLGLMNRYAMSENNGMLFAFPDSQQRSFWMKNTHIPLSIAYISESGQIVDIKNLTPHDERGVPSAFPATYALEMNQGWFGRNQVMCGDTVTGITGIQCESLLRNYVREKLLTESPLRRIIRENLPPWMIDAIKKREEQKDRRREQERRLPLRRPPPELDKINGPEDDENTIDYTVKQELRSYIKELISEKRFKQMNKPKFTDLQHALRASSFLDADPEADLDDEDWSSEAAKVLRDTLNDYFDDKFEAGEITALVKVDMMETDPSKGKDAMLKGASYFFDGLHNIEILLANIADGSTFADVPSAHQKVYEVIMHELLHMQQFLKFSRGNPTMASWNEFKGSYEKAGGSAGMGADYFFFDDPSGPSELETFAFQMANELVDSMGKEDAVIVLQQQNPDHKIIRDNSASFRDIEKRSDVNRPEFREMLKRAKQYAKRMP